MADKKALRLSLRSEQAFFVRVVSAEQSGVGSPAQHYKSLYAHANSDVGDDLLLNSSPLSEDLGSLVGIKAGYNPLAILNHGHRELSEQHRQSLVLPSPQPLKLRLDRCLFQRRSRREFSKQRLITARQLSTMLYYSVGCSKRQVGQVEYQQQLLAISDHAHTYPSGGGLYPIQIYLGLRQKGFCSAGIYRYQALEHSLLPISPWPQWDFQDGSIKVQQVQVFVFFVYQVWRNRHKYGRAATAFALIELGAMLQNFNLVCEALGWASCSWGACPRQRCESDLGLDGLSEQLLHCLCVGGRG